MENKFKAFALSALACATMGLASCSTIEAELPTEIQDEPILNLDGVVNNDLQQIYEALVTNGDTNSERVLNNILTLYAKTLFGDFYGEGGLYEASLDDAKLTAYVSAHAIFGEGETGKKNAKAFINHLIDSIKTQMWSVVQNTTYQKNSVFLEEKFYNAQLAELYKLGEVSDFKEVELDGELTYKDVELYFTDMFNTYKDYIERSLLPTIYRTALVERYIIDNNYGVLGRSYAKLVLANTEADEKYRDLHYLDKLYKGYFDDAEELAFAKTIYADAGFTNIAKNTDTLETYEETTYGDIAMDYNAISDDRNIVGTATDFTNSGAYTKQVGLLLKTRETVATSHVTEGWYTSTSLSNLASSISTRLFKITVANEVDREGAAESNAHGSFGWYVNGSYYMVPETYEQGEAYPYCIYDKDSSTWYIVRVDEAVKAPKLVLGGDASYEKIDGKDIYEIMYSVAGLVSGTESYQKAANQHYVEQMAIAYHDDYVYDYFKATFPDLFD